MNHHRRHRFAIVVSGMASTAVANFAMILLTSGVWFGSYAVSQEQIGHENPLVPTPKVLFANDLLTEEERAWLRDHPVIRVTQDPGWPPVEFADAKGDPIGIVNDYLKLIEQRLGITFERVRNLSWQESYARLKRWDLDMTTSVTVTSERNEFWAFTQPYMKTPLIILTRADVTYISDMRELEGKRVAVVEGYIASELIPRDYPDIQLVKVRSVKEGLDLLQKGSVFALIDNMLVLGYYVTQLELYNLKIAGDTPYVNEQCMAVRKDWAILAGIIQKALDTISESERLVIYNKWVPIRYEKGTNYKLLWKILVVFLVILLGFIIWNWKLSREIRHRKDIEAALRQSEEKFRLLIKLVPIPVSFYNKEGVFYYFNDRFIQVFGYTLEDIPVIEEWWQRAYPDVEYRRWVMETWDSAVEKATREGTDIEPIEYNVTCKNGMVRIVEISGITMGDNFLATFLDFTERKALEEQLQQSQKMESVGRLAGGVAHDFNNMLGVILGHTELALNELKPSDPIYDNLQEIQAAAQRSADLTRQLLAFARKQMVNPIVLDLNDTVSGILKILCRLIGENVELIWIPGYELWPVKMDPSQVDQILANLAVNARDAIEGVGKLTIETKNVCFVDEYFIDHRELVSGEYVLLSISDDGCGMSSETQAHIFEPFFTTKGIGEGTGLGLATVYGAVKQNDGLIRVKSELEKGTTFQLYFPHTETEIIDCLVKQSTSRANGGMETVLLVEDEEMILSLGCRVLQDLGYTVLVASTPIDAIQKVEDYSKDIHLLITDVVMPEMNGLDLKGRIASMKPSIKCLFMSGYTADVIAQHGIVDKEMNFIQKPFSLDSLADKVREVLDQ